MATIAAWEKGANFSPAIFYLSNFFLVMTCYLFICFLVSYYEAHRSTFIVY